MKTISLPQIDSRHTCPPPTFIALVVPLDSLNPEISNRFIAVLAKSDIDQEIAVVRTGLKIWRSLRSSPLVDRRCEVRRAIPAPELAGTFRLVIEGCAEGNDTFDHVGSEQSHAHGDPAALAGTEDEGLLDAEGGEDLDVHDGGVPISEVLGFGACLAVAEEFDGEEVHLGGESFVGVLLAVEL